jgi:hypothetical protein
MRYKLVGVDKETGLETSVIVDASSQPLARAMGEAKGIIVVDCEEVIVKSTESFDWTGAKISEKEEYIGDMFKALAGIAVLIGVLFIGASYLNYRNDPAVAANRADEERAAHRAEIEKKAEPIAEGIRRALGR